MKAKLKLEGDVLTIILSGIKEEERGRVCNIELALLRAYGGHRTMPWVLAGMDGYRVQWVRGRSDEETYRTARKILQGFALEI